MGAILDTPHTEKKSEVGTGNNLRFSVCSMQGWRLEMEDAHCVKIGLPGLPDWSFFAVFDGHAGAYVSANCAENLLDTILQNESFVRHAILATSQAPKSGMSVRSSTSNGDANKSGEATDKAGDEAEAGGGGGGSASSTSERDITCCTNQCDLEQSLANIKSSIRDGFLNLDSAIRASPEVTKGDISGSTAVCCLISPTHFYFANCGDSRAVLSNRGRSIFATQDHKPANPEEKERILRAGGSVMIQRVNGSLAVSRALGDYQYKQVGNLGPCDQLVSPEPEVTILERSDSDEFLILACDGIWDVMTNDDLCDFVRYQLRIHSNLETICSNIIDTCLHKGSTDNMSIVLVTLAGAPQLDESAQRDDKELEAKIEGTAKEILLKNPEARNSIFTLMQQLKNEFEAEAPPGGGLDSKRGLIDKIFKRYQNDNNLDDNSSMGESQDLK